MCVCVCVCVCVGSGGSLFSLKWVKGGKNTSVHLK